MALLSAPDQPANDFTIRIDATHVESGNPVFSEASGDYSTYLAAPLPCTRQGARHDPTPNTYPKQCHAPARKWLVIVR